MIVKIPKDAEVPLIGAICFGFVDRGTNLLQVRPTSICPLNCIFCSTDLGPKSKTRVTEYFVDWEYMVEVGKEIAKFKGNKNLQMHIDFGEPTAYKQIIELVQGLKEIRGVDVVSMETKSLLLEEGKIEELEEVGLTRINLSLDAIDPLITKKLVGSDSYDVSRILEIARYIKKIGIDLLIAPVWVPGINDIEIPKIIGFAKEIGASLGIQKYESHKYGRKPEGIKPISWWKFYRKLEEWEKEFNVKLRITAKDFGIEKRSPVPNVLRKGEKVKVKITIPGWMREEKIGVARNRCITVTNCKAEVGDEVWVRIIKNKDNIYISKII
ncbi:MAG: radical SAM protein [Candidatus Aenigmatarchaeota archaeon]